MGVEYNVLVIKCDGVVFHEIAMPKGKIVFELATEVFDVDESEVNLIHPADELKPDNVYLHPNAEADDTLIIRTDDLTAPGQLEDNPTLDIPSDATEEEEKTESGQHVSCADVTDAYFSDEIERPVPSNHWIEDEDNPLDIRPLPQFRVEMGRAPLPKLASRTRFWPATVVLLLAAIVSLASLGWLMSKTSTQTVSEEFVRVTVKAEPVKKPEPPKPKKVVRTKSKTTKRRAAKAPSNAPAPSASQQTEAVLASLSDLSTGVTNLDVVQSRSKGGTRVSGEVEAYTGKGPIRTGVGRITTAQGALASTDASSTVKASTKGFVSAARQGSVRSLNSEGTLSKKAIARVVQSHLGEVRACYERYLSSRGSSTGQVVARWVIQLDGSVTSAAAASDTLGESRTTDCMLRSIRTWRFPKPDGGTVRVEYPFHFQLSGS